jgi:hypothetical protein
LKLKKRAVHSHTKGIRPVTFPDLIRDTAVLICLLTFLAAALATVLDLYNYIKLEPGTRATLHKLMLGQIIVGAVAAFSAVVIPQPSSTTLPIRSVTLSEENNDPIKAIVPVYPGEEALGLPNVRTDEAPGMTVPAAPYLNDAGISIKEIAPPGSELVIINNRSLYHGQAVLPTTSQNILTQVNTGGSRGPASFTLTFDRPVTSVNFMRPALFPETKSGVTHPSWSAHALDVGGRELSSYSESLGRKLKPQNIPALTVTLTAPGFENISAVRFDSDFRLQGEPFAGFFAVLLERLTWTRRKEAPADH